MRTKAGYDRKLASDNEANLAHSRLSRDIADEYPAPGNAVRRGEAHGDFRRFCEIYFPAAFSFPWSPDHLRVISRIQAAVLDGGLFAMAMPRGSGKTTLCERAVLWSLLCGHRRFVCLVGPTEDHAEKMLEHIKTELSCNERLFADFRSACYPIVRLENNARKAIGQLFRGEQTRIVWSAKRLTFPTMPDDVCDGVNVSGSTVTVAGLTGALRGQSHVLADGTVTRPELVILDDPQTRESANSPSQCADRTAIVNGDVLGMAGPGRKIAAVLPCTVIREGDLADLLLDRRRNPQWHGERTKAVYSWPMAEKRWEAYRALREDGLRCDDKSKMAEVTAYYGDHRDEMDRGSEVAWPSRYAPDELSAIQHMMHLRYDLGDEAFAAEYQNEPFRVEAETLPTLTATAIAEKCSGVKRGIVPRGAEHLTAFIDVHDSLLYWAVTAWSGGFTGWVVDYGVYPEQRKRMFTMRKAEPTLLAIAPGAGREGAILAGLTTLADRLLDREWDQEGSAGIMRVGRCMIDAGYVPDTIYDFCRRSKYAPVLTASRGIGVSATARPMMEYQRRPGERHGWNWLITRTVHRQLPYLRFDSNFWKSFVHTRLAVALGDVGSLSLYGGSGDHHRLIAEHLTAELPKRVSSGGRTVDEWRLRTGIVDNHWLDCVVGCAVAASMTGAVLMGSGMEKAKPKGRKKTLAEVMGAGRNKSFAR